MTETRRQALKILGTIGATCAFPYAADELYGQHVHTLLTQTATGQPYKPSFFTATEFAALSRLSDIIIPPTDTPGAIGAGVPEYIDRVVTLNPQHQPLARYGLAWLGQQARSRFSRDFMRLTGEQQTGILQPVSDELDRRQRAALQARFRADAQGAQVYYFAVTDRDAVAQSPSAPAGDVDPNDPDLPVRFFRLVKNLTADGYYTSRVGLLQELGYLGNTALVKFPGCAVPEH